MTVFFSRLPHRGTKKDNLWTGYLETTYCLEKIAKLYSQIHHYFWKCYISKFRTGYSETIFCWEKIAKFYSEMHRYLRKSCLVRCALLYFEFDFCVFDKKSDLCILNLYRRSSSSINQIVYIDFHVCEYFHQNML